MNSLQQKYDVIWRKEPLCESIATAEISRLKKRSPNRKQSLAKGEQGHEVWHYHHYHFWHGTADSFRDFPGNSWLRRLHCLTLPSALQTASRCIALSHGEYLFGGRISHRTKYPCWFQCHWRGKTLVSVRIKSSGDSWKMPPREEYWKVCYLTLWLTNGFENGWQATPRKLSFLLSQPSQHLSISQNFPYTGNPESHRAPW